MKNLIRIEIKIIFMSITSSWMHFMLNLFSSADTLELFSESKNVDEVRVRMHEK